MTNPLDERLLALTAIITVTFQFSFFLITYFLRFDKVTDFAGTTNFIILAITTLTIGGSYTVRQIVMTSLVLLWGIRLCTFLVYRIALWGEDRRFDEQRDNIGRLVVFWTLQAMWVWTVSLPLTIVNSKATTADLGALDYIGWSIVAGGVILEATADQQKLMFKQMAESRGQWTNAGTWAWSRHPNFFGEMAVWWGMYVSALGDLHGGEHAALLSPVFITLLLLFVSGIPLLEKSSDARYAARPDYQTYKRRTSVLIPVPPRLYDPLPDAIKTYLLLDFPLYNAGLYAAQRHGDGEGDRSVRGDSKVVTGGKALMEGQTAMANTAVDSGEATEEMA